MEPRGKDGSFGGLTANSVRKLKDLEDLGAANAS